MYEFAVGMYPISRANGLVSRPWAGAEVELLDGETFVVEADAVCAAGRPVLDVSQVYISVNHHVSATEEQTRLSDLKGYVGLQ